jgi:hypothetical protein
LLLPPKLHSVLIVTSAFLAIDPSLQLLMVIFFGYSSSGASVLRFRGGWKSG